MSSHATLRRGRIDTWPYPSTNPVSASLRVSYRCPQCAKRVTVSQRGLPLEVLDDPGWHLVRADIEADRLLAKSPQCPHTPP